MKLNRITFTGADNSTNIKELLNIGWESGSYKYIEWAILISESNEGAPRFPTAGWIHSLQQHVKESENKHLLSLHICGHWVRQLLMGINELPKGLTDGFQRIQLNFHDEAIPCRPDRFKEVLKSLGDKQFIFQIDSTGGNKYFDTVRKDIDCVPLFDTSGGAGLVPESWPKANKDVGYCGYAGGLGPENLSYELNRIEKATGDSRAWVDMESKVRSEDNLIFDLDKVRKCVEIFNDHKFAYQDFLTMRDE